MKKYIYILLASLLLVACKKDDGDTYFITANNQPFEIVGARVLTNEYFSGTTIRNLQLYLYTEGVNFNVDETKGNGGVLCINLRLDSTDIKSGTYELNNNIENFTIAPGDTDENGNVSGSYFKYTRSTKVEKDTTFFIVKRGWILIGETDENECNTFKIRLVDEKGDSITGDFYGPHTIIKNMDGIAVGTAEVGDSIYSLQRGELMQWGDIWSCGANYYEIFLYSTNMRTTETGKFQKGLVMVLGLGSTGAEAPKDGTYTLAKGIANGVAWTGRKSNNIDWGCYWYNYQSSTTYEKAFINKGTITLTKEDKLYNITLNCIDQLGDTIRGTYRSSLKTIDLRESNE